MPLMKETTVSQKTGILPRLFARTNPSVLIVKEREIERDFPEVECVKLRQIGVWNGQGSISTRFKGHFYTRRNVILM